MNLLKDESVELADMQFRGQIAEAFIRAHVQPSEWAWQIIRGEAQPSMVDLAQLAHLTGHDVLLSFTPHPTSNEG